MNFKKLTQQDKEDYDPDGYLLVPRWVSLPQHA
jgi:hypothetical protein